MLPDDPVMANLNVTTARERRKTNDGSVLVCVRHALQQGQRIPGTSTHLVVVWLMPLDLSEPRLDTQQWPAGRSAVPGYDARCKLGGA